MLKMEHFGLAAYSLALAIMDGLQRINVLTIEQSEDIVQKAALSTEQTSMISMQPDMMFAAEILHGLYGISGKRK